MNSFKAISSLRFRLQDNVYLTFLAIVAMVVLFVPISALAQLQATADPFTQWIFSGNWTVEAEPKMATCGLDGNGAALSSGEFSDLLPIPPESDRWQLLLEIISDHTVRVLVSSERGGIISSYERSFASIPVALKNTIQAERSHQDGSFNQSWEYYVTNQTLVIEHEIIGVVASFNLTVSPPSSINFQQLMMQSQSHQQTLSFQPQAFQSMALSSSYEWVREFGVSGSDEAYSIIADDGDVYVVGDVSGAIDGQTHLGSDDIFLRKYNASGTKQWTRLWGSTSGENGNGVTLDASGNIYVSGDARGSVAGQPLVGGADFCLAKYDASGNQSWVRMRGSSSTEYGTGVCVDSLGNVYLVGRARGGIDGQTYLGGFGDPCLIKYNSSGVWQWTRMWGSTGREEVYGVVVDGNDNIYVMGTTLGSFGGETNQGNGDFFYSKFDTSGNRLLDRIFGTANEELVDQSDRGSYIAADSCGSIFITGASGPSGGPHDLYLRKFDATDTAEWTETWGSTSFDFAGGVDVDTGGDVYVAGSAAGAIDGEPYVGTQFNFFLTKYTSGGTRESTRMWGATEGNFGFDVSVDSSGDIYVAGAASGSVGGQTHAGNNDAVVTKWDNSVTSLSLDVLSIAPVSGKAIIPVGTTLQKSEFIIVADPPGCLGLVDVSPLIFSTAGVIQVTASSGSSSATTQITVLESNDTLSVSTLADISSVPLDTNNVPIYTTTVSQAVSDQLQMAADAQGVSINFNDWVNIGLVAERIEERGLFDNWLGDMFSDAKALVSDPVHTASGEFYVNDVDLTLAAPTPLEFRRTYSTDNLAPSELGNGWHMSRPYYLFVNNAVYDLAVGVSLPTNAEVRLSEIDGTSLVYSRDTSTATNLLVINGNTNATTEENRRLNNFNQFGASGRSNLRNSMVEYTASNRAFTVCSGDGLIRHFEWQEFGTSGEDGYRNRPYLVYEQQPNGHRFVYAYNSDGLPASISATDESESTVFNSATFSYDANKRLYSITASDGRAIIYQYDSFGDLTKVIRPDGTEIEYEYEHIATGGIPSVYSTHRITAIHKPDDRILENTYYQAGDVVEGETLTNTDYRVGRVFTQQVTQDSPSVLVTNAIISYTMDTNSASIGFGSGEAVLLDALANQTVYQYDTNKQLTATRRYVKARDGNGDPILSGTDFTYELYSVERQVWLDGNLLRTTFADASSNVFSAWKGTYDDRGNLLAEILHGNLTGSFQVPLTFNTNGIPTNGESVTNSYTYTYSTPGNTNDLLNLLTSVTEPNGAVTRLVYDASTNGNVIARFICEPDGDSNPTNNPIYSRTFFDYDSNSVVTNTITDNGTSPDKTILTGVTQRNIQEFIPGVATPEYALPKNIVQKYFEGSVETLFTLQLTYDSQGNPTVSETYNSTNGLLFVSTNQYDVMNRLTVRTDENGDITSFSYDGNGNLTYVDGPRTDLTDTTTNRYDYFDRLVEVIQEDGISNTLSQTFTFDAYGNQLARTNIFGNATTYAYDDLHRLTATILPAMTDAASNTVNPTVTQAYDLFGFVSSSVDANSNETTYLNNIRGQRVKTIYPDATEERFIYETDGSLKQVTAPIGSYTVFDVDFLNRVTNQLIYAADDALLAQESTRYNAFQQLEFTDANTNTFAWSYDGAGRLTALVGPGSTTERSEVHYGYDSIGRVTNIKEWFGAGTNEYTATVLSYDSVGLVRSETIQESDGTVRFRQTFEYDEAGNRTDLINYPDAATNGARTVTAYDALGQPVSVEDAQSNLTQIAYSYSGGLTVTKTDALSNSVVRVSDALQRVSTIEQKDSTNRLLSARTFFYDPQGNRTHWIETVITPGVGQSDSVSAWAFNNRNRPTSFTEAFGSADERNTHYHYNDVGQLSSVRDPNKVELFYFYDARGRVRDLVAADNSIRYRYSYDPKGNVLSIDDAVNSQTAVRVYDAYDRLIRDEQVSGLTLEYVYDRAGRKTRSWLPGSNAVDRVWNAAYLTSVERRTNATSLTASGQIKFQHDYTEYDQAGNLLSVTLSSGQSMSLTTDALNRRMGITTPHWTQTVSQVTGYDSVGNLRDFTIIDPGASGTYSNQYDELYRLNAEIIGHGGVDTNAYVYDSVGNRLTLDGTDFGYRYNDLNELTDVEAGTNVISGNIRVPVSGLYGPTITTDQVSTITVQLNSGSALGATLYTNETWELIDSGERGLSIPVDGLTHTVTVEAVTFGAVTNTKSFTLSYEAETRSSYAYDANGNLVQKTIHAAQPTVFGFDYDALNRLIAVTKTHPTSETVRVEYVYDPFNRRTSSSLSVTSVTSVVHFLWDEQSEIGMTDDSGNLLQLRTLGQGLGNDVGASVGIELRDNTASSWNVYVPIHDHRGNVVLLVDQSSGTAVEYYRYDAFGHVERLGTITGNPWLFSSKRLDEETEFSYFNQRFYDSAIGRFTSKDPLGYLDGFNRYIYVGNNPHSFVDPDGLLAKGANFSVKSAVQAFEALGKGLFADPLGTAKALGLSTIEDAGQAGGALAYLGATLEFDEIKQNVNRAQYEAFLSSLTESTGGEDASPAFRVGSTLPAIVTALITKSFVASKRVDLPAPKTTTVQRWMSRAELEATQKSGLFRGGRGGTHHATGVANRNPLRARQRLSLDHTPEVRVGLEVPAGRFSQPSRIAPLIENGRVTMPGGGMERTAIGDIPARVIKIY